MCNKIKVINEETDISSLKIKTMDWDVEINGTPYQIGKIEGYTHSFQGGSPNDLWCWQRHVIPQSYMEFKPYKGTAGANWGVIFDNERYFSLFSLHYSGCCVEDHYTATITRNGKPFYTCYSLEEAVHLIRKCKSHPLDLQFIDYNKKMIGRKVWWRSEPGVINSWVDGQACVIIRPDGIDCFKCPPEFLKEHLETWKGNDESNYYEDNEVKVNIFSDQIWWFRD